MSDTPQVWESLTAKLKAFLDGLSPEEAAAFAASLAPAAPPEDDVAGYLSPVTAPATPGGLANCHWETQRNPLDGIAPSGFVRHSTCWVCYGVVQYCY